MDEDDRLPSSRADPLSARAAATLVVAAFAAAVVPVPPSVVERFYSRGVFAIVQPIMTSLTNRFSASVLDVFIVVVCGAWAMLAVRDVVGVRGRVLAAAGSIALRTMAWAAVLYLLFLAAWGLNYRRVPLADKLAASSTPGSPEIVRQMAFVAVERANALHAAAHGTPGADALLERAFIRAAREVSAADAVVVGRPKHALTLDWYFRRAAVSGMTDPLFLETLVASDVLPFERSFVIAHEWSHLAGINDEGDANFVGWLACVHASAADQYSGWLFLYQELLAAAARQDRAAIGAALGAGPREDLRAARDRLLRNVNPRVSAAGWRMYDSYLKANRVEAGAASYAGVVKLIVNARFGADWTPVLQR